jgi:hypothetical protein
MPDLTVSATLTFGSTTPTGAVPCREPLDFTITYTEKADKTVAVAANLSDFSITLDSVGAPKFLLVQSIVTDVTVKVSDGVTADPTPTSVVEGSGWIMLANANGQAINELLITTPASPTSGARIRILAVE